MTPAMLVSTAVFAIGVIAVPAAFAQEAPSRVSPPGPRPTPNILLQLAPPPDVPSSGSLTRDDLQHVPPPRPDRLSDSMRGSIVIDDPRCLPGEDENWVYPPAGRRYRRR